MTLCHRPLFVSPLKVFTMSNEDFDSMLAEIAADTDTPVATLPQEDKTVIEHTPSEQKPEDLADVPAESEATMPDLPTPVGKDGGQPLYAEIDPSLKNTFEIEDCNTVRDLTVYPAGYTKVSLNSGRRSNSFFVYEDQWDELTALVRSEQWDQLKAKAKAAGFRNRGA